MKNILLITALSIFAFSCTKVTTEDKKDMVETVSTEKLKHIVLFKFKDETTEQEVNTIIEAFVNLPNEIPEIKAFEWGLNNSPEDLNQEFTHIFTLTFDDDAGRAVYLPHPAHKAFGTILGPHLDKVLVVDYLTK